MSPVDHVEVAVRYSPMWIDDSGTRFDWTGFGVSDDFSTSARPFTERPPRPPAPRWRSAAATAIVGTLGLASLVRRMTPVLATAGSVVLLVYVLAFLRIN